MLYLKTALHSRQALGIDPVRAAALIEEAEAAQARFAALDLKDLATLLGNEPPPVVVEDGVGIIDARGVIGFDLSPLEVALGGLDLAQVTESLKALAKDDSVKRVVIRMESPGGMVLGLQEAMGYLAGYPKPTAVFTRGLLASAGYFYASQADEVGATPGAEVGNAGVYSAFLDSSAAFAANGLKMEVFRSGEYKGAGLAGVALSDRQKEEIQDGIDDMGAALRGMTLARRRFAKASNLQGQTYSGRRAADLGLITTVAPDFESFLAKQKAKAAAA